MVQVQRKFVELAKHIPVCQVGYEANESCSARIGDLLPQHICDGFLVKGRGLLQGKILLALLFLTAWLVIMDVIDYLLLLIFDVRDYIDIEASLICVQVIPDILHCECYRLLHLFKVLNLLYLVVRELILRRAEDTLIAK